MRFVIDEEAGQEAREQVAWYAERDLSTARRIEELIVTTIERIAYDPLQFPLMEIPDNPGGIRRARLPGFPVAIVYQVLEDRVLVLAISHTSRQLGYWRYREQR